MITMKGLLLNEKVILCLILLNALLIFLQEFSFMGSWSDYPEALFTLIFILEMVVKLRGSGSREYFSSSWNRLDFIVILLAIPSLGALFFDFHMITLNFFLTLRALRVFKFFRFFRFFPGITDLTKGIKRAIQASYIVMVGFFMLVFIVSVMTCAMFKNIAPEYFSNPLSSFYSIFRLFTTEGWYEIPDLIAERTIPIYAILTKVYFVVILLCGGILGLSLVNSIFVDAMTSDNTDELEQKVSELSEKIDELKMKIDNMNIHK
ncbi:MAG: ion transporter [Bacteroidales bacterium]